MSFGFNAPIRRILCLGAHADDIEIGCGATLLRLLEAFPDVHVYWQVFSAPGRRRAEAKACAAEFLKKAGRKTVRLSTFQGSYFPRQWASLKDEFEHIKARFEPDLIFTHWRDDRHQDHRVLSDLTWNTFRNHFVMEYEIPKYDGDIGQPNFYVSLEESFCRRKTSMLMKHFKSQAERHWFTEDTFVALMRLRGIECGPRSRFAEAFYVRKMVV
jgi:LmbE family N-acetylglucosaminyl deacetylase